MVRYLADPANAITSAGLLFSTLGLYLIMSGHPELGIAAALWAMLADQFDGVVAVRTRNRMPDAAKIGKSLDGFADLVYGAVVPAVVVIQVSGASPTSLLTSMALLLAGALRLSYFNNFGLSSDGRFMGVPLSYDVPLLAVLFLMRPWLPPTSFALVLNVAFLVLAALHIAPLRVRAISGAMYGIVTLFSVLASIALMMRAFA